MTSIRAARISDAKTGSPTSVRRTELELQLDQHDGVRPDWAKPGGEDVGNERREQGAGVCEE
jgi:hypothetical protein